MITLASIYKVALENGAKQEDLPQEDDFEVVNTVVVHPDENVAPSNTTSDNPLKKYALNGMSSQYRQQMNDDEFVLDGIALRGQITNIYAAPGSGKTLLTMKLLMNQLSSDSQIYYVNADDNHKGLTEKLQIAEKHGFQMIAPGHLNFKAAELIEFLSQMAEEGLASGVVIVLDTLKKFTDPMSKNDARKFWNAARQFVSKGGTVITLSHANKLPDSNGRPIFAGTSDSLDDTDCAFTLRVLKVDEVEKLRIVEFENIKNRGQVESKVCYQYSIETGLRYEALLDSVERIDTDLIPANPETSNDERLISIVEECITEGVNKKMKLIDALVEHSGTSKRKARALIEQYTGDDPTLHKWNFERGDRGAHIFKLLQPLNDTGETC